MLNISDNVPMFVFGEVLQFPWALSQYLLKVSEQTTFNTVRVFSDLPKAVV